MLSAEAETLIIPDITKTESNNCFIIHCRFEENNDKRIIALPHKKDFNTWANSFLSCGSSIFFSLRYS